MDKSHQEILSKIKHFSREEKGVNQRKEYTGSTHFCYGITVPESRQIAKDWVNNNKNISVEKFIDLLNSLYQGLSIEEKKMAGQILEYLPKQRSQINPNLLNSWLNELEGWEEIDSLCQSVFSEKEILENFNNWKSLIEKLSKEQSLVKKRASLVLLTGVVSHSGDKRLAELAFEVIDRLKLETEILIAKAISWLLRDLIKNYRSEVESYLLKNRTTLPKIAVREVQSKLNTGKK